MVRQIRAQMPRLVTRKLYHLLGAELPESRDKLFSTLRANRLPVKPVRSYTKTTDSKRWMRKYPNLLKEIIPRRQEQVYASDTTYIKSRQKTHYLSLVTDAWSRKIVGYHLSDDLSAESVVQAMRMAVIERTTTLPLIHHSDRRLQYCSEVYQKLLRKYGITPSMAEGHGCYQDALAERVNGVLKHELLFTRRNNGKQLNALIRQSAEAYNNKRPHLSLNMTTPNLIHKTTPR